MTQQGRLRPACRVRTPAPDRDMRAPFPRTARLRTPADFARLRGISRRVGGETLRAEVAPAHGETAARLGLAVSRRVSKSAVRRNRIKRIARDSFQIGRASCRGRVGVLR